ncbi:MAG: O-antigen ligase family protein [Rhodothermales bacterium]
MVWGTRALAATLVGILVALLSLAWYAPEALPFLPLALVGLCGIAVLSRYPLANLGVVLAGFVFAVNSDEGLQISEVVYGLYLYAYVFFWYARRLLRGDKILFSATDRAALLFIVGGAFLGVAMALVFGASLSDLRSDLTAFLVLALYFPVKEACRCAPRGPDVIVYVLIGLGIFLGIQNFIVFRSIISSATLAWQVADARFAATEALIMISSSGVLFLLLDAERWRHRLGLLVLLLFMLASLILTKGRTFWMAFAFGTVLSLLFLGGRQRFRLIFLTTVGSAVLVLITVTFFGQLADLVFSGTLRRLATLQDASSQDLSLIARFIEWNALWDYIVRNPVLGYGFGTTYQFYDIMDVGTVDRTFTHNGYLGAWFKLGIFGLLVLLFLWVSGIWDAVVVYRTRLLSERYRTYALLSIVSLAALALAANASIFFIYMNQLFPFALLTGMASGLRQRNLSLVGQSRAAAVQAHTAGSAL